MTRRSEWPIVVGGCLRTGTSLVRRILDAHPRIHCPPEITFLRDFFGGYPEDPLAHVRFSKTVRDLVSEEEALEVLGHAFVELHEHAARRAGKPRWADKVPENVLHRDAWDSLLGDRWLFVHVVRGPLDTVASMHGRFPLSLPLDISGKVELYRTYVEAGLKVERAQPDRSFRVVYEELCADPASVVERLMDRLGEAFEPVQLAFNSVPHDEGLEDPEVARTDAVHREGVGRWRSVLDEADAGLVWSRTHDLWEAIDPDGRYAEAPFRVR